MDLLGRTILITRAAAQSRELRHDLEAAGARVLECPAIEIVPVEDYSPVDQAIARLKSYNWILFTSTNAVDYFMRRAEALNAFPIPAPMAAVGTVTVRQLRRWNHDAVIVPEEFRAEGLLHAFPGDMTGQRILFPRAESGRDLLPGDLRKRGATVDLVAVYRTLAAPGLARLAEVVATENPDCVVFTSPSAIHAVAGTLGANMNALLAGAAIAVIGPVVRQAAEASGLTVTIEAAQATMGDLVNAIRKHFAGK